MNNKTLIKFGDWFTWESHDDYVDEAMDDSADIAAMSYPWAWTRSNGAPDRELSAKSRSTNRRLDVQKSVYKARRFRHTR